MEEDYGIDVEAARGAGNKYFEFLDEYEKSLNELIETINDISEKELAKIIDFETNDEDCKSIQSILTHVVQSGYTYVVEIRKWLGENLEYRNKINFQTAKE